MPSSTPMPGEQPDGFADNWSYIKTELNWLDRVLMLAVARQRKDTKDIDRVAQSRTDKATSHWWKGLIALDATLTHDEIRKTAQTPVINKQNYQQQLDSQIQASQHRGVVLGLPLLRDRLQLSLFEKNLILMSLAPEVNRRFAQLYRYLQSEDAAPKSDLPTVDLVLKLLCRNDTEWRIARNHLLSSSPLLRHQLIQFVPQVGETLLNSPLKLADPLVNFLLADHPQIQSLDSLLQPLQVPPIPRFLDQQFHATAWHDLVLPEPALQSLQFLSQSLHVRSQVDQTWGFATHQLDLQPGIIALMVGAAGTGKTTAARAIAHSLQTPLVSVDLALVEPTHYAELLQEIATQAPTVLLLQSAQQILRRSMGFTEVMVRRFLRERHQYPGITLLAVPLAQSVDSCWRSQIDQTITLPMPSEAERLTLWQRAFPAQVPLNQTLPWDWVAQLPLTGGEIKAIARQATFHLATSQDTELSTQHLIQALKQARIPLKTQPPVASKPKRRSRSTAQSTSKAPSKAPKKSPHPDHDD